MILGLGLDLNPGDARRRRFLFRVGLDEGLGLREPLPFEIVLGRLPSVNLETLSSPMLLVSESVKSSSSKMTYLLFSSAGT